MTTLTLEWISGTFAVVRFPADSTIPQWAEYSSGLYSMTRTDMEVSIVLTDESVPKDQPDCVRGFAALRVKGTLDFSLIGILSTLTGVLAGASVPVFAISTFDTDYLLVQSIDAAKAHAALSAVTVFSNSHSA